MPNEECTQTDVTELVAQARVAYEQKRTRECVALIRQLSLADPGNAEAKELLSAIRVDMQQDLRDARALLEQAGASDEKKKYRKAAEIILLKSLYIDPENDEAKILLQSARAAQQVPEARPAEARGSVEAPSNAEAPSNQVPFVAGPALFENFGNKKKSSGLKVSLGLIATLLLGGGVLRAVQLHWTNPKAPANPIQRTESIHRSNVEPPLANVAYLQSPSPDAPLPAPAVAQPAAATQTPVAVEVPSPTRSSAAIAAPVANPVAAPAPPAPPAMGKLAISASTAAEIYQGDRNLGSVPTTLQLPAGRQTLEYRNGDLRTVASYDIKPNETTTASVAFQITVQINAKPWAQVFLEGSQRQPLGQTPLSGVSVPVGGVLTFENPNFPPKNIRITEKDTTVQINFP